jgi:hypothetical protein
MIFFMEDMDHLRCWEEVRCKESWRNSKFDSYSLRQQQGCDGVKLKAGQVILFLTTGAFFFTFSQITISEKWRRKFGDRDGNSTPP